MFNCHCNTHADFTFVCPTEIIAFSDRAKEFEALNCQVRGRRGGRRAAGRRAPLGRGFCPPRPLPQMRTHFKVTPHPTRPPCPPSPGEKAPVLFLKAPALPPFLPRAADCREHRHPRGAPGLDQDRPQPGRAGPHADTHHRRRHKGGHDALLFVVIFVFYTSNLCTLCMFRA